MVNSKTSESSSAWVCPGCPKCMPRLAGPANAGEKSWERYAQLVSNGSERGEIKKSEKREKWKTGTNGNDSVQRLSNDSEWLSKMFKSRGKLIAFQLLSNDSELFGNLESIMFNGALLARNDCPKWAGVESEKSEKSGKLKPENKKTIYSKGL